MDYNFVHSNTGIGVKANVNIICFQFSANYSDIYLSSKFNIAMRIAIESTEAYLNQYWRNNPMVVPDLLNSIWYNNIKAGLASQFGPSASVSTNCSGVPAQPAYWKC
jgi:hypothetical protein